MDKLHAPRPLEITVSNRKLSGVGTALALIVSDKNNGCRFALNALSPAYDGLLQDYDVSSDGDAVTILPGLAGHKNLVTVAVGLNSQAHSTALGPENTRELISHCESLRQAAGAITQKVRHFKDITLAFTNVEGNLINSVEEIVAVAEGAALGCYGFKLHREGRSVDARSKTKLTNISILSAIQKTDDLEQKTNQALVLADAVNHARDLVNQPPNLLTPATFTQHVLNAVKNLPLKATVWGEKELTRERCHSLLAVGQGSIYSPRLIKIEYRPGVTDAKRLALVGKGITFDSGGLSLKPPASMTTMKADMAGAATILATIRAAAQAQLGTAVTAWLCIAENMPSQTAQRPGDVYTAKNGKTIEVLNTDAEGRLAMADGLCAASEENPDVIVDVATLTGAQRIALGPTVSAIMGDHHVSKAVKDAADVSGEKFWPMPLPEELRSTLNSAVADIANVGDKGGGMLTAGLFLREFVGANPHDNRRIPWAHLDIAGPSYNESKPWGYTPRGGTGVGVRTLMKYIKMLETSRSRLPKEKPKHS